MDKLKGLQPERVFHYFEQLSAVPRGSGNREPIAAYCMQVAKELGLRASEDAAHNVIIYKNASAGCENAEPVILQGHLDMVCQKEDGCTIDFEKDGLDLYVQDGYIHARGTTLGADNGIAVAIALAILEDKSLKHPPLEAVFTADEEIGMLGAVDLDFSGIKGKKMINIDAEDPQTITVSCAGGSDFSMTLPITRKSENGALVTLWIKGLKGGHSGVEIDKGRVNANLLMARVLNYAQSVCDFSLISIDGGDKGNAIPLASCAKLVTANPALLQEKLQAYANVVQAEMASREPDLTFTAEIGSTQSCSVMEDDCKNKVIFGLLCAPNGIQEMSMEIQGLVETSLNLGILKTEEQSVFMHFALRSNKKSALQFLEDKLFAYAKQLGAVVKIGGHYPPWEFKENSKLQELYQKLAAEQWGFTPEVVAIHAGLECGVFSDNIKGLDCIAVGPELLDIHTTAERVRIASVEKLYTLLLSVLEEL